MLGRNKLTSATKILKFVNGLGVYGCIGSYHLQTPFFLIVPEYFGHELFEDYTSVRFPYTRKECIELNIACVLYYKSYSDFKFKTFTQTQFAVFLKSALGNYIQEVCTYWIKEQERISQGLEENTEENYDEYLKRVEMLREQILDMGKHVYVPITRNEIIEERGVFMNLTKKMIRQLLMNQGTLTYIKHKKTDFMLGFLSKDHFAKMEERLQTKFTMNIDYELEKHSMVFGDYIVEDGECQHCSHFLLWSKGELKVVNYEQLKKFFKTKHGAFVKQYITRCICALEYASPREILETLVENGTSVKRFVDSNQQAMHGYFATNTPNHRQELQDLLQRRISYERIQGLSDLWDEYPSTLSNDDPYLVHLGDTTTTLSTFTLFSDLTLELSKYFMPEYQELISRKIKEERL